MHKKKIITSDIKFPDGFLWGTATAAHQVEGNNINSDWWHWEKRKKLIPDSGLACDHYHLFKKDFKLAKEVLHNNAHRLSIEWARIEPSEGKFNKKETKHYINVLKELKKMGFKVMLTLHHFVNPLWFSQKAGFEKKKNVYYFDKFIWYCAEQFTGYVDYWVIFNEPNVYASMAYLMGYWPPQKRSILKAAQIIFNMAKAHSHAYKIIHQINHGAKVGSVINQTYYKSYRYIDMPLIPLYKFITNDSFIFLTKGNWDFLGINYYALHVVRWGDLFLKRPFPAETEKVQLREMTDLGWPIYPQGIYFVAREAWKKYRLPIFITENGLADKTDSKRARFIINHLHWLAQAMKEGADVRGYFHWTLMDNFEWHLGRSPKFGLFKTNFKTLERIPRKSAYVYGEIAKNNAIIL